MCESLNFHFFSLIVIVPRLHRHTMPLATRITKMLNIEHPVVMGGMTGTGTPELAAAVSNAGGLGLFALLAETRNYRVRCPLVAHTPACY